MDQINPRHSRNHTSYDSSCCSLAEIGLRNFFYDPSPPTAIEQIKKAIQKVSLYSYVKAIYCTTCPEWNSSQEKYEEALKEIGFKIIAEFNSGHTKSKKGEPAKIKMWLLEL